MKIEHKLFLVVVAFLAALLAFFIVMNRTSLVSNKAASTNTSDMAVEFRQRFQKIEDSLAGLTQKQTDQENSLASLEGTLKNQKSLTVLTGKKILGTAKTQGSLFTTSSASYTPMGMYVTINCPISCNIWVDFFTSSKNQVAPPSAQGFFNTYGLFVDGVDRSITSQASFVAAGSAVPFSLNGLFPVSSGVHTIDVQAKTTGGTLESDSSFLQIMAIEQ